MLPDWQYLLWDEADKSALMLRSFPDLASRFEAIPYGVAKADIARYAFLYERGGFYFDTDYRLLRPINEQLLQHCCIIPIEHRWTLSERPSGHVELGNSLLASEQGHPFWRELVYYIFNEKHPEELNDMGQIIPVTGPVVLTEFYMQNASRFPEIVTPEKNVFQPDIRWFALSSSADDETYGMHLHWGSWRERKPLIAASTIVRRKLNGLMS
jgi:mannosyltransferase OCH1-like enzyme